MPNVIDRAEKDRSWIVYQDTSRACYVPMFRLELAAWLFSAHMGKDGPREIDETAQEMYAVKIERWLGPCDEDTPIILERVVKILDLVIPQRSTRVEPFGLCYTYGDLMKIIRLGAQREQLVATLLDELYASKEWRK